MITVPVYRDRLLTANQRLHWAVKSNRTKTIRETAWACVQMNGSYPTPYPHKVRGVVTIQYPDRRRRDAHNLMPTIKAAIDGIVDAGILEDDSDKWLVGPDLRVSETLCDKRFACVLDFEFEAAS